jgi:DNA-directed RNA polymerase specialized sigma24 family protein
VLYAQLDEKLRSAPGVIGERDRSLFWLYYLQGLTAEEIARQPSAGLTAKGVESALRRVTTWLRAEIEGSKAGSRAESGSM